MIRTGSTAQNIDGLPIDGFRTSSSSTTNCSCVEAGAWSTSSASSNVTSVETMSDGRIVLVRDSKVSRELDAETRKKPDATPTLNFSLSAWQGFVDLEAAQRELDSLYGGIRKNSRSLSSNAIGSSIVTRVLNDGTTFAQVPNGTGTFDWVKSDQPKVSLTFTSAEIAAFDDGVDRDEFDLSEALMRELGAQMLAGELVSA